MPPVMADYRVQARRRMKRGLHPDVVAAAGMQASTGEPRTNMTGNARAGQQFRDVEENGHHVHVYANGQRVGVAGPPSPYSPARRTGFGPNTGQGQTFPKPPDGTGAFTDQAAAMAKVQAQRGAPAALGQGPAPSRPIDPGRADEAALKALALAKINMQAQVPKVPVGSERSRTVHELLAKGLSPGRRRRRRGTGMITGGMLAS